MKVLIADDELMECRGLEWMLRKNFPSLVILPYAKNGVELLRIVEESYPDLILMDIHMPGMNGLEALEIIALKQKPCRVIIVSAYSQFAYAQEAMRLGASEYLLKPVEPGTLRQAVQRQIDILEKDYARTHLEADFENLEKDYHGLLETKLSVDLAAGNLSEAESLKQLAILGIHPAGGVICCKLQSLPEKSAPSLEYLTELQHYCSCIGCQQRDSLVLFIFPDTLIQDDYKKGIEEIFTSMMDQMAAKGFSSVFVGISSWKQSLGEISRAVQECTIALRFRKAGISFYEETSEQENLSECNVYLQFRRLYLKALAEGKEESCAKELDSYLETAGKNTDPALLHLFCADLAARGLVQKYYSSEQDIAFWNCYRKMLAASGKAEMTAVFDDIMNHPADYIMQPLYGGSGNRQYSQHIASTLMFMRKNYMKNLSLEDVAKETSITPYYLSRLFKQELHQTFLDVLTDIRMEQALELIYHRNNLTAKEISSMVGYPNSNYFFKLFKTRTGLTLGQVKAYIKELA